MNSSTDPPWARSGRAAAVAAFDRTEDTARILPLNTDTGPSAAPFRATGSAESPDLPDGADSTVGSVLTTLRFDHGAFDLVLCVYAHGHLRSVEGQVSGDFDYATLRIRRPGYRQSSRIGPDGRFAVASLARGPLSVEVQRPGHPPVVTDWFTI